MVGLLHHLNLTLFVGPHERHAKCVIDAARDTYLFVLVELLRVYIKAFLIIWLNNHQKGLFGERLVKVQ